MKGGHRPSFKRITTPKLKKTKDKKQHKNDVKIETKSVMERIFDYMMYGESTLIWYCILVSLLIFYVVYTAHFILYPKWSYLRKN